MKRISVFYKIIVAAAALVLTLALYACSGNNDGQEGLDMNGGKDTAIGKWLDAHGLEYGLLDNGLSPEELMKLFEKEIETGKREGYTPVIVVDDGTDDSLLLTMFREHDIDALLKAELPDGKEYLDSILKEYEDPSDPSLDAFDFDQMRDDSAQSMALDSFSSYSLELGSRAYLVKVPTDKPWEAVLYLPFGGWNNCPAPEDMAAVCKYWYEKYSAQPALISGDEMNFYLPSPIPGSQVNEAAKEHFAFCEDVLFQGMGYFNALEDYIRESTVWYFWWD